MNKFFNYPIIELIIDDKYKTINFQIPKNCSSTLLLAATIHNITTDIDVTKKIWNLYDKKYFIKHNVIQAYYSPEECKEKFDYNKYKDYKKFIVLRHPIQRFYSYMNNCLWTTYNKYSDIIVDNTKFADIILDKYENIIDYNSNYDKHATPQRNYYYMYKDIFNNDFDVVMDFTLNDYYKDLTGEELIENNVTSPQKRYYNILTLTDEQNQKVKDILNKYEYCDNGEYISQFKKYFDDDNLYNI